MFKNNYVLSFLGEGGFFINTYIYLSLPRCPLSKTADILTTRAAPWFLHPCNNCYLYLFGLVRVWKITIEWKNDSSSSQHDSSLPTSNKPVVTCSITRKLKSFLNIKAWRHVRVEAHNTNMNLKMSVICLCSVKLHWCTQNKCITFNSIDSIQNQHN